MTSGVRRQSAVQRTFDIVGLGDCGVDIFVRVERLPRWGDKLPGDLLGIEGGGVVANFCCAASTLGLRTALLSSVGDDEFGRVAVASVSNLGVDVAGVVVKSGVRTYFSTVCLDARGEKALTIVRTPAFFPRWKEVDQRRLTEGRALHIAPFDLAVAMRAAAIARKAGVLVSVDLEPAMIAEGIASLAELLQFTDLLFINDLSVAELFGEDKYKTAARELLGMGPTAVIVTRGANGVYARSGGEECSIPAYEVEVRDTTGAGDCFNAAFLAEWLRGASLPEAATFAAAAAAVSITGVGARSRLPTRPQVARFLRQQRERTHQGEADSAFEHPR